MTPAPNDSRDVIGSDMSLPEQRPQGIQKLRYTTPPALTAILSPEQVRDQLRIAIAALEERHEAMVAALEADLEHAETGVKDATARIATAPDKQHQREIAIYNEGYFDCLTRVVELVKRGTS